MSISLTSPVTGGAQTGFSAPTYTIVTDSPALGAVKSWVVTALGGTQAGVTSHSIARPFTVSWFASKNYVLPQPDTNGIVRKVPINIHQLIVRAGVLPLAGQANHISVARARFEIPAGSDTADTAQLRALVSMMVGCLSQNSAGFGDTLINGVT